MNIAFLLHLYQPVTQSESVFRSIFQFSYNPLLRRIARTRNFKVSLDVPLSLLEQMDRYGYTDWISELRVLMQSGKIELVGSGAYHPLLSKLSSVLVEKEVILNEFGQGYYLGDHSSLEGEPAIVLHDVRGFFPPELAVNDSVFDTLDSLGYSWVLVDESAIPFDPTYPHKHGVYHYKDFTARVVCRNRSLSNALSFKRDLNMDVFSRALNFAKANDHSFVIALDGEFFGHHYDDGLILLDSFVDLVHSLGGEFVTVSEYVNREPERTLKALHESSWGASDEDIQQGRPYPFWEDSTNKLQSVLWSLIDSLQNTYEPLTLLTTDLSDYATVPIWLASGLSKISDSVLRRKIAREVLLLKALHSDMFWWASNKTLFTGDCLFNAPMVRKGLAILDSYADLCFSGDALADFKSRLQEAQELLASTS